MVRRKTFCVKDFSTIFLRVVWISETSCKSLSINDLQAQGGGARKCLTINDLRTLDFLLSFFSENKPCAKSNLWYILTMTNEITSLATETCEEVYADANAFFDYLNSNTDVNAMLDALNGTYSNSETLVEVV